MPWLRWHLTLIVTALVVAAEPARAANCENAVPGQLYVSHAASASDENAGTCEAPFRTIQRGLDALALGPGRTLNLRRGVYLERVHVHQQHGTEEHPVTIRSYPGEQASIDASLRRFRNLSHRRWRPATDLFANAHPQEYVSRPLKGPVNRGAFIGPCRYTRLITYKRLSDLRASNELRGLHAPTYMGPGLWFGGGRVHIRLSHTHNDVPGLADYHGRTNPQQVPLALSRAEDIALRVSGSSYVRFAHLTIAGGDDYTAHIENVSNVQFDHVDILSTTHGVRTNKATALTFAHSRFLGGLPDWFFRSDAKGGIGPGAQTSKALLFGTSHDTGTRIHHSEFRDGHDLYLSGNDIDFHHNWIDNLDDEALLLDAVPSHDVRVHENVITRSLSAISFADDARGGPHRIYRNLIDLRRPTAGNRPRSADDPNVMRYGHLVKSNDPDGPWELFQNTFLVSSQLKGPAFYTHLRATPGSALHQALNNVFVGVRRPGTSCKPILLEPGPTPPTVSDGNAYFRIGCESEDPSGHEPHGIDGNPGFRRLGADGLSRPTDDLRLKAGSPASNAGLDLTGPLPVLDPWDVPGSPSIGAYRADERRLRTGVDGQHVFPHL